MTTWFTSDWHIGHARILELGEGRPFVSIEEHDEALIAYHNSVVAPDDRVYVLGDVALGKLDESLPKVARFNGFKILVAGNHDRVFSGYKANDPRYAERFMPQYEAVFDKVIAFGSIGRYLNDETYAVMSHFPYNGDHTEDERYSAYRPTDLGDILIHGHLHAKEMVSWSKWGSLQIHVGVDSHSYYPVSESEILQIIKDNTHV